MNESEKERLIKKDIVSIENRVRHAFNQGYEMGLKESRSEIPNTCGDAISRQSAIFIASDLKQDLPDDERIADMVMAHNEGILEYQTQLSLLPSVSLQQRTGQWIHAKVGKLFPSNDFMCSECRNILDFDGVNCGRGDANYCPNCGAKMEVEE